MQIPLHGQAVFIENNRLILQKTTIPQPGPDEVLIRVAYAGLNRADLFQREGSYPAPEGMANIPGLEVCGQIVASGKEVHGWKEGNRVCALLSGGGYAEYVLAKAAHCLPVPDPLGPKEAAALPECVCTTWMVKEEAQLEPGERVLIHGGASGIGTTAIQMLRAYGCEVYCTAGTAAKVHLCEQLGAQAIQYRQNDFVSIIRESGGVDVVLDMVGGDYIERSLQCLRPGGRLISIAFLHGNRIEINAGRLLLKRLRWIGTTLRARSDDEKTQYLAHIRRTVWPWVAEGHLRPVIDSVFPLDEAEAAQEKMQKYLHCGKILLHISDET